MNRFLKKFMLLALSLVLGLSVAVLTGCQIFAPNLPESSESTDTATETATDSESSTGPATVTTYAVLIEQFSHGVITSDKEKAEEGEVVTLTAQTDNGYTLGYVKYNGTEISLTEAGYVFTMPAEDVTVTAAAVLAANVKTGAASGQLELESRISADTAKSYWSAQYGETALEISVYVEDAKISDGRDAVEMYIGKSGYENTKLNPSVNRGYKVTMGNPTVVTVLTTDGQAWAASEETADAEVLLWSSDSENLTGYYVSVKVPYTQLGLEAKPAEGTLTLLPVLSNYTGSLGTTASYNGYESTNPGAYLVVEGDALTENYYALGTGVLGSCDNIVSEYWDLSKDYAIQDTENYANREIRLTADSRTDNDVTFFRAKGADAYVEATITAGTVRNGERWGKFGIMMYDGGDKTGVFYYVDSFSNDSGIIGRDLGFNQATGYYNAWQTCKSGVFDLETLTITLKMAYVSSEGAVYMYYVDSLGRTVLANKLKYNANGDVVMGFKSFNIDLVVKNYYSTSNPEDEKFRAVFDDVSEITKGPLGDSSWGFLGSGYNLEKNYEEGSENFATREVRLTEPAGDNDIFFTATEGKSAYVRATFTINQVLNGEDWGKFGLMFFDGASQHGLFFYVDAFVGNAHDGVIRGRQLGYNYAPNGWGNWNSLNKAGEVFNLSTKTITLAMTYADSVLSMYYEGANGDVLVYQSAFSPTTNKYVLGIKAFNFDMTVSNYYCITDTANDEFKAHNPTIEQRDLDVLFAGDSYMEFWKNYGVWYTLTDDLTAQGKALEDVGVGGTMVPYWNNNGMISMLSLLYNPANVVFHIGVNDVDSGRRVEDTAADITSMVYNYHKAFPEAKIYWVSCIPNNFYIVNNNTETYNASYKDLNTRVKALAEETSYFTYIDEESVFTDENGNARTNMFMPDGLHLNAVYGYPLWTGVIKEALGYATAGSVSKILGDLEVEHAQRAATSPWVYGENGMVAEITAPRTYGQNVNTEEITYVKDVYASDLYFEAELRSPDRYYPDDYSKAGIALINDDITIFVYLLSNNDPWQNNGKSVQWVGIIYRNNVVNAAGPVGAADWNWSTMSKYDKQMDAINVCDDFQKLAVSKVGSTFNVYVNGMLMRSYECGTGEGQIPVKATDKFAAAVMGFNRYIQVKDVKVIAGASEIDYYLAKPHNVNVPSYTGVEIEANKTSAKKTDAISFTVAPQYAGVTVDKVYAVYGGSEYEIEAVDGVYSFVMPDCDVAIKVTFLGLVSITLDSSVAGKVSVSEASVLPGETVTFKIADGNYIIDELYANGSLIEVVDGVYALKVVENVTVSGKLLYTNDGIVLDGKVDEKYGTVYTNNVMTGNRGYNLIAYKGANGIYVWTEAYSDTYNDSLTDGIWNINSNIEFYLNNGEQYHVTAAGDVAGVTQFVWLHSVVTEGQYAGKHRSVVEFFIEKSRVNNWSDNGEVQLNYAWMPGGIGNDLAMLLSDCIIPSGNYHDAGWWANHLYGGCNHFNFAHNRVNNLMITENGLKLDRVQPDEGNNVVIDGVINEARWGNVQWVDLGNTAKLDVYAFAGTDGLYLGLVVRHGNWSGLNPTAWWLNDNIEIFVNGVPSGITWLNGNFVAGELFTKAVSKDTVVGDTINTTIELFMPGHYDEYLVQLGGNGTGFGGWNAYAWDSYYIQVKSDSALLVDGILNESYWTPEVFSNTISTVNGNGAGITIAAVYHNGYVYVGVCVTHNQVYADQLNGNLGEWWNFMNIELRLSNDTGRQICTSVMGGGRYNQFCASGYHLDYLGSAANPTPDGHLFQTTFEMVIVPEAATIAPDAEGRIAVSFAACVDGGFNWLWGSNDWRTTHYITDHGIVAA